MPRLWQVDRYGWTWLTNTVTAKKLAEVWANGNATEVRIDVPGRRDITA